MKLKQMFLVGCLMLSGVVGASENRHVYPEADSANKNSLKWPGYCQIEVVNDSFTNIRVYGIFEDGVILRPFNIYTYEYPHYISLYYYGYCHYGMNIYIDTWSGYRIYAGYTMTNTTLHVVPYMMKEKPKIEIMHQEKKSSGNETCDK